MPLFNTQQQNSVTAKKSQGPIESLMRKKIDELNESAEFMDSNDFAVSDSNFSMSFRSKDAMNSAKGTAKTSAQKKQFYFYE
jgi:hypothetical protein